jgi:hypothetical protein
MATTHEPDSTEPPPLIELPAPTAWPLTLAFGVTLLAGGLVTDATISMLGAVLLIAGAVGWFRDVLPVERTIEVPVEPEPLVAARPPTTHPGVTEQAHRENVPVEVYPISAGIKGGIAGGVVMAFLAVAYGVLSHHSVWYPINLLAASAYEPLRERTTAELAAFDGTALVIAIIIHGLASLLVGALYGVLLPIVPRRPILVGGVAAPVAWTALLYPTIGIIDPVLAQRINWGWFIASQIGFGVVAGLIVRRSGRIRTPQPPHVAAELDRSSRAQP